MFYTILNMKLQKAERVHADCLYDAIEMACNLYDWKKEDCISINY